MNSELIACPACKHALRVPENLFGKPVRCPECKSYFTAPTHDAEGKLGEPVLLPQPTPRAQPAAAGTRVSDSPLFMPAMLLILVSFVGFIVNGYMTWMVFTDFARAEQAIGWLFQGQQDERVLRGAPIAFSVVFSFNVISLLAGFAILFRRYRWLGILGSVLAMINIGNCCCLLGLPAGGYCLIKLIDPDLKPLFTRK